MRFFLPSPWSGLRAFCCLDTCFQTCHLLKVTTANTAPKNLLFVRFHGTLIWDIIKSAKARRQRHRRAHIYRHRSQVLLYLRRMRGARTEPHGRASGDRGSETHGEDQLPGRVVRAVSAKNNMNEAVDTFFVSLNWSMLKRQCPAVLNILLIFLLIWFNPWLTNLHKCMNRTKAFTFCSLPSELQYKYVPFCNPCVFKTFSGLLHCLDSYTIIKI